MIQKERTKPRKLYFFEALLRRFLADNPKITVIEPAKSRVEAGYLGEQRIDYYLNFLPEKDYYIFHDLHLFNGKFHFQIDTLIITSTYILVIEIKNMNGELDFHENSGQLIQKKDNIQNGYDDPLLQAEFQVRQLKELLLKNHFPELPFEYLVMIANPNFILNLTKSSKAQNRVCRGHLLVKRIEALTKKYQLEKLTPEKIRKMSKCLLKNHTEPSITIENYHISRGEIQTGVHCPDLCVLGMTYNRGKWTCPKCGYISKDAHLFALQDYFLLFGPSITNLQFREFLHLSSDDIANKMLRKLNLPYTGKNKQRIYQLSWKNIL